MRTRAAACPLQWRSRARPAARADRTGEVEVQLRAREAAARVDELDLVDDAFVALAAGDAEGGARGFGARFGGGERVAGRLQAVERLLHFELDLQRDLVAPRGGLACGGARAARFGAVGAAVEELPGQHQRDHAEVAATAELVVLALRAAIDAERQRGFEIGARDLHAGLGGAARRDRAARAPGGSRAPRPRSAARSLHGARDLAFTLAGISSVSSGD